MSFSPITQGFPHHTGEGGDMLTQAHIYSSCSRDNRGVVKLIVSRSEEMLMNFVQRNILFRVYSGHFQSSTKKLRLWKQFLKNNLGCKGLKIRKLERNNSSCNAEH